MTDDDIGQLAGAVAGMVIDKLSASVIPSSFPPEIGEWIAGTARYSSLLWTHTIPMNPPGTCMLTDWKLNPDGTMQLELRDSSGFTFWRGTFRPAEAANAHA
jgi:hypothetical protein